MFNRGKWLEPENINYKLVTLGVTGAIRADIKDTLSSSGIKKDHQTTLIYQLHIAAVQHLVSITNTFEMLLQESQQNEKKRKDTPQ